MKPLDNKEEICTGSICVLALEILQGTRYEKLGCTVWVFLVSLARWSVYKLKVHAKHRLSWWNQEIRTTQTAAQFFFTFFFLYQNINYTTFPDMCSVVIGHLKELSESWWGTCYLLWASAETNMLHHPTQMFITSQLLKQPCTVLNFQIESRNRERL